MAIKPMYPGSPYSPQTTLAASIGAADTSITLADASILPAPPNYITIGSAGDSNCETILYQVRTGNTLSGLTRGVEGTAASHNAGDPVGSYITAALINNIIENVNGAFTEISQVGEGKEPKFTDASEKTVAFSAAVERAALTSGDTLKVLFGKLLKWLSDLKAAALWVDTAVDAHGTLFAAKMPLKTRFIRITSSTTLSVEHTEAFLFTESASTITLTIPAGSAIPAGSLINIINIGAGTVTFAAASGVALYSKESARSIDVQYAGAVLYKESDTVWYCVGALA